MGVRPMPALQVVLVLNVGAAYSLAPREGAGRPVWVRFVAWLLSSLN